jgi:DNA helicase HerA-like ATPase
MHAATWFDIFVAVSASAEVGYLVMRYRSQRMKDTSHATYELTFPRDLDMAAAARLFESLSGLYAPIGRLGEPFGRATIVFEVLGTPTAVHHLVSFPRNLADTVRGNLRAVIPGVGFSETTTYPTNWSSVVELGRHQDNDNEADPNLVSVLLNSLTSLQQGEKVLIQFVITPTGGHKKDNKPFFAVGRLAAAGHEIRADYLIKRTLIAYRSLQVFQFRRLPRMWFDRVNQRAAPITHWPIEISFESLAVICGLPIGGPQVPGMTLDRGRRLVPASAIPSTGLIVGTSNYPDAVRPLAMDVADIARHVHVLGKTGVGKSTELENLSVQIMQQDGGLTFIDPHGDSIHNLLDRVPRDRVNDVVHLDLTDARRPVGFNALEGDPYRVTNQVMAVFDKLYDIYRMPQTADILRSTVLSLSQVGMTLLDIPAVLAATDAGQRLRDSIVGQLTEPALKDFWRQYDGFKNERKSEIIAPLIRRIRPFETYPSLRGSLGQSKSSFQFDEVLRDRKIVLVNLSKGQLGEEESKLYGSFLVAKFVDAVMNRSALGRSERTPYTLFIDEFHNYANLHISFSAVLAEVRKQQVGLVVAHQYLGQLPPDLREGVLSQASNKVIFSLSANDAVTMAREVPAIRAEDLQALGRYEAMVRLVVDNEEMEPATVATLPPHPVIKGSRAAVTAASAAAYGMDLVDVELALRQRQRVATAARTKPSVGRVDVMDVVS